MKEFFRNSLAFATAVVKDPRIPARDKAVLGAMLALVLSPIDIIPDFIPLFGQLDDAIILVLMLDYLCNRVPEEVIREHFPWNPEKLAAWRKRVGFFTRLVPHWAREKIWKAKDEIAVKSGQEAEAPQA